MDFVIQWACYLLAFVAGSAVAWLVVTMSIAREGLQQPVKEAPSTPATGEQ